MPEKHVDEVGKWNNVPSVFTGHATGYKQWLDMGVDEKIRQ